MNNYSSKVAKLPTGIDGFDGISMGGLPKGRTTLIAGTAGSAKTIFAIQFLANGIMNYGENGVFVTFEETPDDIRNNFISLGWDIRKWEKEGKWFFVDASPQPSDQPIVAGQYDLGALIARIEFAVKKVGAKRISLDSFGAIFSRFFEVNIIRGELFRIATALKQLDVTGVLTAERTEEYGEIARYGVEEFVADNVVIFRNVLEAEKRRRTVEILKFRGTMHQKGEYPFTIIPDSGIVVIPLSAIELEQRSSSVRITSGNPELDMMCSGGFFRDSIILVSGATGTGKTLMVTEFMAGGVRNNERTLLFAFEESREQLIRNASGWGIDYEKIEREGTLKILARYPESAGLEDHLIWMKKEIDKFNPGRIAVDSLSALERVSSIKGYREFMIGLTSLIKQQEAVGMVTSTTPTLLGGTSITEAHISTITDCIILLRYVEIFGEMRRCLTVLKMRGSIHEKNIREYTIDGNGYHIGKPFTRATGILSGNILHVAQDETDRLDGFFDELAKDQ
jgi:circadian clock protein KaiC